VSLFFPQTALYPSKPFALTGKAIAADVIIDISRLIMDSLLIFKLITSSVLIPYVPKQL
jgi:hypothetical protein